MYSVNAVPLDNPTLGWSLRSPTQPLSTITRDRASLQQAGRDGVVTGLSATARPVTLPFVVGTERANLETLLALFGDGGKLSVTGSAGREVEFETLSADPAGYGDADWLVDVTFQLRLPSVYWRDKLDTTSPAVTLAAASQTVSCFTGLSAAVPDALIRVKGAASGIQVTDSSGAWVTLPNVAAGQWLRFDSASGQAFVTTADTWAGGTDVSGQVDFGGPRGVFEITPSLAPLDPRVRSGALTVTTTARTAAAVSVRGKAAYVL